MWWANVHERHVVPFLQILAVLLCCWNTPSSFQSLEFGFVFLRLLLYIWILSNIVNGMIEMISYHCFRCVWMESHDIRKWNIIVIETQSQTHFFKKKEKRKKYNEQQYDVVRKNVNLLWRSNEKIKVKMWFIRVIPSDRSNENEMFVFTRRHSSSKLFSTKVRSVPRLITNPAFPVFLLIMWITRISIGGIWHFSSLLWYNTRCEYDCCVWLFERIAAIIIFSQWVCKSGHSLKGFV